VSITEREGFWKRLSGTMGKRIKEEVKRNTETEIVPSGN
jgi:hypothetical protein